jgi:hypothetical protein
VPTTDRSTQEMPMRTHASTTATGTTGLGPSSSSWRCEADDGGVTALSAAGPGAHVAVHEDDARVRLEFWMSEGVPRQVRAELARRVFAHPALRARRSVVAALPQGQSEVLQELRTRVADARTHVAGATCLLEGHVR